jgi:steroid Delta-isomerase
MSRRIRLGSGSLRRLLFPFAALALLLAQAAPATAQTADPAQTIQSYFHAVDTLDGELFVSLFTPDALLEDPIGVAEYRGHRALREWFSAVAGPFTDIEAVLQRVLVVSPTDAAVLWTTFNHTPDGRVLEVQGIGVYRFNADGKIRHAREYWDMPGLIARISGTPYEPPVFASEAPARAYFGYASTLEVEPTVDLFRPEGVLHDPVGTAPHRGHQAIRDYLTGLTGPFASFDFTFQAVIPVSDDHVAVAWTVEARTRDGRTIELPGIGAFHVEDGKLRSVEEYWRLSDLLGQL